MLAFSTCWNSARHTDGEEMIEEILRLGFDTVELSHGVRITLLEGVRKIYERGDVRISSLHNFCPLPVEVTTASPNCYQYTSHVRTERERAVRLTRQTIDWAARLQAAFVVLHLGSVPMPAVTDQLADLILAGKQFTREFTQKKLAAVREREAKGPMYVQRALIALKAVAAYAAERNIYLGIESREAYEEIPNEREMLSMLEDVNSPYVGYWHDFGHIQRKANLSFLDHYEWLSSMRHRIFGCHLHDTIWPDRDHNVPFAGSIPFDRLVPLIPPRTLFTWELSPRRKVEEIQQARQKWLEKFPETVE